MRRHDPSPPAGVKVGQVHFGHIKAVGSVRLLTVVAP